MEEEQKEAPKPRKERTKANVGLYVLGCSQWAWFKSGSCKPRLYAIKEVEGFNKLVVFDTKRSASQSEFTLLVSAEPIDMVAELEKSGHVLVGKVKRPPPPKKKKKRT